MIVRRMSEPRDKLVDNFMHALNQHIGAMVARVDPSTFSQTAGWVKYTLAALLDHVEQKIDEAGKPGQPL